MTRRRRRQLAAALAAVAFLAGAAGAGAEPGAPAESGGKVVWAVLDFPPFQILGGRFRGGGSFDGLSELLFRQLPDYDHEVVAMTFARREEELRQGHLLCTPGMFRTPAREKLLVFSRPALIHLDNRVVFLVSGASRFGSEPVIDADALFQRPDLIGGIISERSYAPNIDGLLRRHGNRPNLVRRPMKAAQMLEMVFSGEVDYTILFPHEAAYLARHLGRSEPLAVRPIAGTPPHIATHVACTRSEWGERVVRRIDAVLDPLRATSHYRSLSERWYGEPDKALIRQYYPQLLAPAQAARTTP